VQSLLVVAYLRKGETYTDLACGFAIGTTTVYRYPREALDLLAAMAPTLAEAIEVARGKAYVVLDGTLLRISRTRYFAGILSSDVWATIGPRVDCLPRPRYERARSAVPHPLRLRRRGQRRPPWPSRPDRAAA
jgi:hypothetical protein